MLPPRAAPRPIGGGAWIPGPQALQPPQPRDISASNRAPGLALRSRERESLEAPGGSSRSRVVLALGLEGAHTPDCNPGGLWSTPSIHHRFLFSLSPPPNFATAQISQFIAPSFSFSILQCVDRIGILKGYASHHYSSNTTSVNLEGFPNTAMQPE